jgi:hypothetical protein
MIAVCSEIHTKHINTLCGQNVEFVNVKHGGKYSYHWALQGQVACFRRGAQTQADGLSAGEHYTGLLQKLLLPCPQDTVTQPILSQLNTIRTSP